MVERWYVQVGGETVGPLSRAGLVRRLWSGRIGPDTAVRQDGQNDWRAASAVPGLLDEAAALGLPRGESPPHVSKATASVGESEVESEWFVQLVDSEAGPFSLNDLKRQIDAGKLQPQTLVRQGGDDFWVAARSTPALSDAFKTTRTE